MATGGNSKAPQYMRISDIAKEPQKMLMPIRGYENEPLVPLEKAVEPLVSILPDVLDYVYVAKQRCEPVPADGLTQEESAAIVLYTMEWEPHEQCLYFALNSTLRTEDRRKLKPWFSYLRLLLTALVKIPSTRHFVYRGVKMDLSKHYPVGKTVVWWGFSSCTLKMGVLENEQFLGKTGERTLFTIDCESGKDIGRHSYYESEGEILLLAARQFVVKDCLEPGNGLHMIQLTETESPIKLLQMAPGNSSSNKSIASKKKTCLFHSLGLHWSENSGYTSLNCDRDCFCNDS